jgi:hypothetical protein
MPADIGSIPTEALTAEVKRREEAAILATRAAQAVKSGTVVTISCPADGCVRGRLMVDAKNGITVDCGLCKGTGTLAARVA